MTMMYKLKITILTVVVTGSATLLYANTAETKPAPAYGDNPNLLKVLAVKTQEKVQDTAERVGSATERGISKIKPGVDNTVKKMTETKNNILGKNSANVPIERGSLSQDTGTNQNQYTNQPQVTSTTVQTTPLEVDSTPITSTPQVSDLTKTESQIESVQGTTQSAPSQPESEITKKSLPIENAAPKNQKLDDDTDEGIPR